MEPGLSKVKARSIKPVPSSNLKVNSKFKILSHREYVKWANELSKRKHYKIEELSSGVAYCIILNNIAPKAMPLKHVKMDPTSKPESIHNLRLLQAALMKLKCEKEIPISNIVEAHYKDNFAFAKWFKQFYDSLIEHKNIDIEPAKIKIEPKAIKIEPTENIDFNLKYEKFIISKGIKNEKKV
uniref:Calponin-homology (CH) domain-containing protein n=1 Tax=Megaselia scalaris TaxID=36166 RepID=T1GAD3_MEGSC